MFFIITVVSIVFMVGLYHTASYLEDKWYAVRGLTKPKTPTESVVHILETQCGFMQPHLKPDITVNDLISKLLSDICNHTDFIPTLKREGFMIITAKQFNDRIDHPLGYSHALMRGDSYIGFNYLTDLK